MTFQPNIYTWEKTWIAEQARFFPLAGAISSTSQYTGNTRASQLSNSPWVAQLQLGARAERDWADIEAFLARLDGPSNWVRLFHPLKRLPRGYACGIYRDDSGNVVTPLGTTKFSDLTSFSDGTVFTEGGFVAMLARTHFRGEDNVLVTGLGASQATSIKTGDYMEIGGFLHMALSTVASNSAGQTLVPIRPRLRLDIPVGSALNYVNFYYPTSPFMLATPNFDGFDINAPDIAKIGLSFIEAPPLP